MPEYTRYTARVRKWSTVNIAKRIYSVPSRLKGHVVELRVFADVVELRFGDKLLETMPRLRGEKNHRIDYRHVIWSVRRAYDALRDARGDRADVEYVRVLHLAASTSERSVEAALAPCSRVGRHSTSPRMSRDAIRFTYAPTA